MFGVTIKMTATPKRLEKAVDKGAYKSLRHAAFSIRKAAQESMVFAKGPSKPGAPPHAHTGRMRWSILVAQDKVDGRKLKAGEVFIGPAYSRVKVGGRPPWLAEMLEHGKTFIAHEKQSRRGRPRKGTSIKRWAVIYPARPFMQPALQRNLARFHRDWQGAI